MTQVNIYEAKATLSDLVERAANGEDIVIAKAGKPKVRLVSVTRRTEPREPGRWKGKIWISPDFDEPIDALFDVLNEE